MNDAQKTIPRGHRESLVSAISAGFFFVLAGTIFIITPDLYNDAKTFFLDFKTVQVPNANIFLPVPASPDAHLAIYSAVKLFCIVWAIFELVLLILRVIVHSAVDKEAETASNIIFWSGASYLIQTLLNEATTITIWFTFWSEIIMLIGITLVTRAVVLAAARLKH